MPTGQTVEGTVVVVADGMTHAGGLSHSRPIHSTRTGADSGGLAVFVAASDGWTPVDADVLAEAEIGDKVRVDQDVEGGTLNVEVLEESMPTARAMPAPAKAVHPVDIVLMTPAGSDITDDDVTAATTQLAQVSTYWTTQSGSMVTFAINGSITQAPGQLANCQDPEAAWSAAATLKGWDPTLTQAPGPNRHLLVIVPRGCVASDNDGAVGIGTVGG
jgi:hypothetical protein